MNGVVNEVSVDANEVRVGITDEARWNWDIDDGCSGADARTILFVRLFHEGDSQVATNETVHYFCGRDDPLRADLHLFIPLLFAIAWNIRDGKLSREEARKSYFGVRLTPS